MNCILLAETAGLDGRVRTLLVANEAGLEVRLDDEAAASTLDLPLPPGAVERVMQRYARPIDETLESDVARLEPGLLLENGASLCCFRFRPRYDVIAKDYVVWRSPGQPSRAELATSVAAALTHLAQAWRARQVPDPPP